MTSPIGGAPQHITRMTWYVTDKREYLAAGRAVGQAFKDLIENPLGLVA